MCYSFIRKRIHLFTENIHFWNNLYLPSTIIRFLQSNLTTERNYYKIKLKMLEDELLEQLSSVEGDVLDDKKLVENLESSKNMATEIVKKVSESGQASLKIDEAREQFRPVATRASILFFVVNDLYKINPIYQFSLKVRFFDFALFLFIYLSYYVFFNLVKVSVYFIQYNSYFSRSLVFFKMHL